jgi:hypothetical protein
LFLLESLAFSELDILQSSLKNVNGPPYCIAANSLAAKPAAGGRMHSHHGRKAG